MADAWNTSLTAIRRFFAEIIARLTRWTPGDDSHSSWAQPVKSLSAVPDAYKSFFGPVLAGGRPFPYAVLAPTFDGYLHPETEKLVCTLDRAVWILERSGDAFLSISFPVGTISYLETRTVLLDSHIKITGLTSDGVPASTTLRFNAVTDYLFTPVLDFIRLAAGERSQNTSVLQSEIFDGWMSASFKFMNYARRSVLGGETVVQAVLQPEIRRKVMAFLGMSFYRRVSPSLACILTDWELILIREETHQVAGEKYGGIWDYIPLDKIEKLSLVPRDDGVAVFSVQLPHNERLEALFELSAKPGMDRLIDRFMEVRGM